MPTYLQRRTRIKEFADVAGNISDDTARKILEQHNWNVEESLDYFFNNRWRYPEAKQGDRNKLGKLFGQYADKEDQSLMGEDGMMKFYKDVGVDPNGVQTLQIAWHIKSSEMGLIQKDEFIEGFSKSGCSSIGDIKNTVSQVCRSLNQDKQFKSFYKWLFVHCKEDEKKKTIPSELALQLWTIALGNDRHKYPMLDPWLEFVDRRKNGDLKAISRDVWEQILDFFREVKKPSEYDEGAAWPVAIDEFMEEYIEKNGK